MYIAKVVSGTASLWTTTGAEYRKIGNGGAVQAFAGDGYCIVTYNSGSCILYKDTGAEIRKFVFSSNEFAVSAVLSGNEIIITMKNGVNKVYNFQGAIIRSM